MVRNIYVVTSGTRMGFTLHRGNYYKMKNAMKKAKMLKAKGKKDIAIRRLLAHRELKFIKKVM